MIERGLTATEPSDICTLIVAGSKRLSVGRESALFLARGRRDGVGMGKDRRGIVGSVVGRHGGRGSDWEKKAVN